MKTKGSVSRCCCGPRDCCVCSDSSHTQADIDDSFSLSGIDVYQSVVDNVLRVCPDSVVSATTNATMASSGTCNTSVDPNAIGFGRLSLFIPYYDTTGLQGVQIIRATASANINETGITNLQADTGDLGDVDTLTISPAVNFDLGITADSVVLYSVDSIVRNATSCTYNIRCQSTLNYLAWAESGSDRAEVSGMITDDVIISTNVTSTGVSFPNPSRRCEARTNRTPWSMTGTADSDITWEITPSTRPECDSSGQPEPENPLDPGFMMTQMIRDSGLE